MNAAHCPLAGYPIDARAARVVGACVVLALIASFFVPAAAAGIALVLAADYGSRALSRPRLSPLGRLGELVLRTLGIAPLRVDAGPKRFAAWLGGSFSLAIALAHLAGAATLATVFTAVLLACAFLEAAFDFCIGCHMWTLGWNLRARISPAE